MQLPGASHPQGLTRDRSDLSAWRADWNYLGLHTSVTSPGSRCLSIFLAQSTVEQQRREDELSSPGLEQPEVTSMQ